MALCASDWLLAQHIFGRWRLATLLTRRCQSLAWRRFAWRQIHVFEYLYTVWREWSDLALEPEDDPQSDNAFYVGYFTIQMHTYRHRDTPPCLTP